MTDINLALASNGGAVTTATNASSTGSLTDYDKDWMINGGSPLYDGNDAHVYGYAEPETMVISLACTSTVSSVVLWFDDLTGRSSDPSGSDTGTNFIGSAFTIETWNGSSWDLRDTQVANDHVKYTATFSASTDKVRLIVTADAGGAFTGLIREFQIWGAFPAGSAAGTSTVSGVGGSTAPDGAGSAAGTSTALAYSPSGDGVAAGTSTAAAVGLSVSQGVGVAAGTSAAYGHPPYSLNYKLGTIASVTAHTRGNLTITHTPTLINDDLFVSYLDAEAGSAADDVYVEFTFSSAKWIAGVRLYTGSSGAAQCTLRSIVDGTFLSSPTPFYTGTVLTTYAGSPAATQTMLLPGDLAYTTNIVVKMTIGDIYEVQVIGVGLLITGEYSDGAEATSDDLIAVHKIAFTSTADATTTLSGNVAANLVSSANATATDNSSGKHKETLTSTAAATADAIPVLVGVMESTADASATALSVRPMTLESSAVVSATMAAKIVHTETSGADAEAETTPGRVIAGTEESTADATDTLIGIRHVTVTEVSSGDISATDASKAVVTLTLLSETEATSVFIGRATMHATEVSGANASSYIRLPAGELPIFWTNARTMAAAVWEGMPFNSLVELGGVAYAADVVGIRKLVTEGDDIAEPIESEVAWDLVDYGSSKKKRLRAAYVRAKAAGPFRVRVIGEQGGYDYQTHLASSSVQTNHRAPLGRGWNCVEYRFGILQDNYFSLSGVLVEMGDTTRRI